MMKAIPCAAFFLLSACATVSMVSQEAVVETGADTQASALGQSADEFTQTAAEEGWVSEQRSLMDFANILFGGDSEQTDRNPASYAERISAAEAEVADVFSTVTADTRNAAEAFSQIQLLSSAALVDGTVTRNDLISFETALVTAQKSHRSFAEATGIAAGRGTQGLGPAEAALADFAAAIDRARGSADKLAEAYASSSSDTAANS